MAICIKCKKDKAESLVLGICTKCQLREIIRRQNKNIEGWLLNYEARKKEFNLSREEIEVGLREVDENVGGGRSSLPGRPTETMACNLIQRDSSEDAIWLGVVEDVKEFLGERKRFLLEVRQEGKYIVDNGRPNWKKYVLNRFEQKMGFSPSDEYLTDMWQDIMNVTARIAAERGCTL